MSNGFFEYKKSRIETMKKYNEVLQPQLVKGKQPNEKKKFPE